VSTFLNFSFIASRQHLAEVPVTSCKHNLKWKFNLKNYIIQHPILASLIVYTTDWELHLLVINLKGSIYSFLCPWSGISEVRTADSYGASEFMSVWSFSGVCVAQSSVFSVFVIFCQPLNICLFVYLDKGMLWNQWLLFFFIAAQFWKFTSQIRNTFFGVHFS
jgi:hypothetical protein